MYLIEIYDENDFIKQFPMLHVNIQSTFTNQKATNFEFCQCLSLDGLNLEIAYEDPNSNLTACIECTVNCTNVTLDIQED